MKTNNQVRILTNRDIDALSAMCATTRDYTTAMRLPDTGLIDSKQSGRLDLSPSMLLKSDPLKYK